MKPKHLYLLFACTMLLATILWIIWGNTALEVSTYQIPHALLPEAFDGYRIAHISDLHNTQIGKNNKRLLSMLREAEPDMIAITGDLIDSRRTDTAVSLAFVREAVKIAPCYYVPGNHESRIAAYDAFKEDLIDAGVTVLEDAQVTIVRSDASITVLGVKDPAFSDDPDAAVIDAALAALSPGTDDFTVLLSHRPELFERYVKHGINLVFSGHAHGGQLRLPLLGGLIAPNQGFLPKYDSGLYTALDTNMLVSRGIGNSLFPFRFNNRPEIILVELRCS